MIEKFLRGEVTTDGSHIPDTKVDDSRKGIFLSALVAFISFTFFSTAASMTLLQYFEGEKIVAALKGVAGVSLLLSLFACIVYASKIGGNLCEPLDEAGKEKVATLALKFRKVTEKAPGKLGDSGSSRPFWKDLELRCSAGLRGLVSCVISTILLGSCLVLALHLGSRIASEVKKANGFSGDLVYGQLVLLVVTACALAWCLLSMSLCLQENRIYEKVWESIQENQKQGQVR